MDLQEIITRSKAAKRYNVHTPCDLRTVLTEVRHFPGQTVYWHYGKSVSRSYAYAAFQRAAKHGLIKGDYNGHITVYYITELGEEFLEKY